MIKLEKNSIGMPAFGYNRRTNTYMAGYVVTISKMLDANGTSLFVWLNDVPPELYRPYQRDTQFRACDVYGSYKDMVKEHPEVNDFRK